MKKILTSIVLLAALFVPSAMQAADQFVTFQDQDNALCIYPSQQGPVQIVFDQNDYPGIRRALDNLSKDFEQVTGQSAARILNQAECDAPILLVGSVEKSGLIQQLVKRKAIDAKELNGKREKYIITLLDVTALLKRTDKDNRSIAFGLG